MIEFLLKSQAVKTELKLPERALCRSLALPRSTYQRWRTRCQSGADIVRTPGPPKLGPLPLAQLQEQIKALPHGPKRTGGTGALRRRYAQSISRRAFQILVRQARREHRRQQRAQLQNITWSAPHLAWAIDAAEYRRDAAGQKLYFAATQDLASRYCFTPWADVQLCGEAIAAHLHKLFDQHGAPLLLKRDNGSLFNNGSVDEVLARWQVLPLNSPPYYARYNGAMEKSVGQLKAQLPTCLTPPPCWKDMKVTPLLSSLCHLHNAKPRRVLGGKSACEIFYQPVRARFNQQARHDAFEWIKSQATTKLKLMEQPNRRDFAQAWRESTVTWLVCQGLITVSETQPSVTPFSPKMVS